MSENFSNEIRLAIEKTNHLLMSHGLKEIQENPDFVESDFSHENHAEYTVLKEGCVELCIRFTKGGVEIGITDFYEFYDFSYDDIFSNSRHYEECLSNLLFKPIVVKKCLFGFCFVYTKDSDGEVVLIRKIYEGLASLLLFPLARLPVGCKCIEYRPLYHVNRTP